MPTDTTAIRGDHHARQALILAHTGLAKSLALRFAGRLPACVELDDLIGAGMLGLMDAVDRFDETRSIPFEAYARTRIQGAILDALRAEDHLSRRDRRRGREADHAEDKLRARLGRELTPDEVHSARNGVERTLPHAQTFVALDEADGGGAGEADAFARLSSAEDLARLRAAVARLSPRDQTVLSLYYEEELTYREIGQVLSVTESRICQILRGLQKKLRAELESG
jgi:RNA polymerase sigma factor for flagellar operon FliA